MIPMRCLPLALCVALGAACSSAPHSALAPLRPWRLVDSQLQIQPTGGGMLPPPFLAENAAEVLDEAAEERFLFVQVRMLALAPERIEELLGAQ